MKGMTSIQGLLNSIKRREGRLRRNKSKVFFPDVRTFALSLKVLLLGKTQTNLFFCSLIRTFVSE